MAVNKQGLQSQQVSLLRQFAGSEFIDTVAWHVPEIKAVSRLWRRGLLERGLFNHASRFSLPAAGREALEEYDAKAH